MAEIEIVPPPNNHDRIKSYLATHATSDVLTTANQLQRTDAPLASTVVLIPVAAEQEAQWIPRAMHAYAQQQGNEQFSICLLANHRSEGYDAAKVDKTLGAIHVAQSTHEHTLDIRYAQATFDQPRIGAIRKLLWDSAIHLASVEAGYGSAGNTIGLNHDIDTVSMGRHYIRNVQQTYQALGAHDKYHLGQIPLPPRTSLTSHALPRANHPNTARAIMLQDLSVRQVRDYSGYEAGGIAPFAFYARSGGFNAEDITHETRKVFAGATVPCVPGSYIVTSPRRYIDRFPTHGFYIWDDGNFSDKDACRTDGIKPDCEEYKLNGFVERYFYTLTTPYLERAKSLAKHKLLGQKVTSLDSLHDWRSLYIDRAEALAKRSFLLTDFPDLANQVNFQSSI